VEKITVSISDAEVLGGGGKVSDGTITNESTKNESSVSLSCAKVIEPTKIIIAAMGQNFII
jgi:hypothetical protein